MIHRPLPAHSKHLRERRYEVDILGPKNERGGRVALHTGRFTTFEHGAEWADAEHPDAEVVRVTFYTARTGWKAQHVTQRVDGQWL